MKILVLGATGMAGHLISVYFKELGHDVIAFSRQKFEHAHHMIGDVTDFAFIEKTIKAENFDAIVNAIGLLNHHAEANPAQAILLNSYLPHFLSHVTKEMKTKIIHMSTDCVFSGKSGSYLETSFKDGETFYDRSKALGELENHKDLTFRNSIIGPDMKVAGIGLLNWFMKQKVAVSGFTHAIWTGVTTLTLAKAMSVALDENLSGLYHLVNNETISKFELLGLFNQHLRNNEIRIEPSDRLSVDKSLLNSRNDFSFLVPSYEEMIIEMKAWIDNHQYLYPHYFK